MSLSLVFQYGSNTSSKRLNSGDRLKGDARLIGIACTENNYELVFDIWSKTNNCAAADIILGSGRPIWGVLYEIPKELIYRKLSGTRKSLDQIEGESTNYSRTTISLMQPDEKRITENAITYIGRNRKENIKTAWNYVHRVLTGLRENDIPRDYIEYVKERIIANNAELRTCVDEIDA